MFLQTIKAIIHPFETIHRIVDSSVDRTETLLQQDRFEKTSIDLTYQTLHSKEPGISKEQYGYSEIIVSLTSYSKRIHEVYLAIESIMQGSLKPNRIILWLSETEFKNKVLPITLQNQTKRGLEIRYCKDIRSFKKLIYTLKDYPEATIITIDDDAIYKFDFIENFIKSHNENPLYIYANRVHRIKTNPDGSLKNYHNWEWNATISTPQKNDLFFTGVGGVLYPPHSLHEEVFNEDVFLKICSTADDVWFNAMARLKGTEIHKSFTHDSKGEDYLINLKFQADGLGSTNNNPNNCKNDIQIKSVFEKYHILKY